MREKYTHPLKSQAEIQERQQKSFRVEECRKESQIALPIDEETQNQAGEPGEIQVKKSEKPHKDPLKAHKKTQIHSSMSFEPQENTRQREIVPLMLRIGERSQPCEATKLQEENTNEPLTVPLVAQTAEEKQLKKAPKSREKMKEKPSFLSKTQTETNPLRRANERWAKSLKRMTGVQTPSLPEKAKKPKPPELREKGVEETPEAIVDVLEEETAKAIIDVLEEDEIPTSSAGQLWIKKTKETWRATPTKKETPQNPTRQPFGPKVNPATAALRKQFADIQNKISPAKPATPLIRWTPNLSVPPPDGPDLPYPPSEARSLEGFPSTPKPPKVSKAELRKRKREEEQREREEREMDEALDTEVVPDLKPPKRRRGEKRLNELEEAMKAAGMYPEDPDRNTKEKGKGRARGRGDGGKTERP
ncbi:hypothetical protein VE03_10116, partial [Pseudogymnoascus sp. 23342-1-I1]